MCRAHCGLLLDVEAKSDEVSFCIAGHVSIAIEAICVERVRVSVIGRTEASSPPFTAMRARVIEVIAACMHARDIIAGA